MKILFQISLISFFMLLNLDNNSTTRFCNDKNSVTMKTGKQCVTIHNLPNGCCKKKIRIIKGNDYSVYIPFKDSSLIYFCMDEQETLNYEKIKNMHTAVSCWRLNHKLYSALKKDLHIELQSFYSNYSKECGCSFSDIYEYDTCKTIDLRGKNDNKYWRDIWEGEYCIGYIVFDSTYIASFDFFLDKAADNLRIQSCED